MNFIFLNEIGIILIFVGIILVILAILGSARNSEKTKNEVAGVIMIGPIPIIFGTDKKSLKNVIILAIILTATVIVATILWYLLQR